MTAGLKTRAVRIASRAFPAMLGEDLVMPE
jgi:hypothetical protein